MSYLRALTILVMLNFAIVLVPLSAYSQSSSYGSSYSGRSAVSTKKIKRDHDGRWSFIIPSVVVHGIKPDVESSEVMPRKMDKGGNTVFTPGIGFKYQGPEGGLAVAGVVKDCYDNMAGALQWGRYFNISPRTHWGITGGLYIRETPYACDEVYRGGQLQTECIEMDDFNAKWIVNMNGANIDFIPMPFLHFATALYRDRDFEIQFKVMSNIVLNEFGLAIPF